MTQPNTPDYQAIEWDKDGQPLADDPHAMLALPEALLALEGLPVAFHGALAYPVTQDKVLAAARHIIEHRTPEQAQKRFHSQAEVMAYASQQFDWHTGADMNLVAVANYMGLPKQSEEVKQARAAELDMLIEVMKSGMLTTREGARKAFPDRDVDAIWDKHEQEQKAAVEAQKQGIPPDGKAAESATSSPASTRQAASSDGADKSWSNAEKQRRAHRSNPCLGF